jgi:hypothetical protein
LKTAGAALILHGVCTTPVCRSVLSLKPADFFTTWLPTRRLEVHGSCPMQEDTVHSSKTSSASPTRQSAEPCFGGVTGLPGLEMTESAGRVSGLDPRLVKRTYYRIGGYSPNPILFNHPLQFSRKDHVPAKIIQPNALIEVLNGS